MKKMLLVCVCLFLLAGCKPKETSSTISVSTSFYPLYFFTSQLAGGNASVYNITPAGAEPHDYEPTPQQVATIENSKLLVLNGGNLEPWGKSVSDTLQGTPTQVIVAGEDLTTHQLNEDGEKIIDPHIWLSPKLALKEVQKIKTGLQSVDPTHMSDYETTSANLSKRLEDLDAEYTKGLANCVTKDIVTSHAAFGYLATDYGLKQVSIAGLSPDEEPSSKQLAQVADFARKNNIHTIFFESLVSPKLSETIATEIGAKTLVLDPIEGVSDADIQSGRNYFTIMEENLANLRTALSCQ